MDALDPNGRLVSKTSPAGQITNYFYRTDGKLDRVTDPFGHTLTFGYNPSGHVSTITDAASHVIGYSYDANNNLTRVDYPDNTAKIYHYENTSFPNHLTGISYVDAGGMTARYSTYAYDTSGKAIRTEHAQTDNGSAQERFTLNYDSDTQTTVTDPIGMNEVMTFATNLGVKNLVTKTSSIDTKSVQQVFDGNNNLVCRKDEENRVTTYAYNATNQRTGMTEGLTGNCTNPAPIMGVTRTITYEYLSPTLDLPRFIRRPSVATGQTFETEMVYGDVGHPNLPTQIIQRGYTPTGASVSRSVALGYNSFGQVNHINGPRTDVNDVTTLEYYECTTGGACGQLMRVTNALGHTTTYDLYDANGRLKQMTDPNGLVTTYSYDPRGRVKTITRTPASGSAATTQYSYTPWGDVSQVIDPDGVVLNYQYDAAQNLRFIVDAAGNYIHYKYDLKGNRTGEDIRDNWGYLRRTVGYAYDLRNRPSQVNLASDITQIVHDAAGNITSETDPNNHDTTHQYDALNRLFKTVNALSQETNYGLDVNDRPTVVTAPNGLSTQYQHDDLGNLLREISPDRRTTDYTHDAAGNVLTVKDARNITTTYAYDALNRVVSMQSTDASTPGYSYAYDTCFKGRLCYFPGTLLFGYDSLGRLNYQLDLKTFLYSSYVFTSAGRLARIDYPNGMAVDYTYDFQNTGSPKTGNVVRVSTTLDDTTTVLAQNFAYYPFGPVNRFSFGNGQYFFMNVDLAYRPTFQRSGPRFKTAFYDPAGNLNALDDINGTAQTFTYDALDELTSASDTQTGSYGSLGYTYLPNGNRETETRNGVVSEYSYIGNRLSNTSSLYWLYDTAGNAYWSNYAYVMAYDGYGRMTSALSGAATYEYNPFHQRIRKTAGGITTRFHYGPSGEMLFETGGGGNKAYVYLNGMPLARIDNNSQIYYYHTDHLGTPQAMTDSSGTVVWKATYDPFGQATVDEDPDGDGNLVKNNRRYAGQYFDAQTGLHYNWHRYYDPKVGRYISSDAIGLRGGLNTYLYARANPLRYIDPTGLETTLVCRPVDLVGDIGLSKPVHCSVIVWHWEEKCGKKVRVIDAQYSLPGGAQNPTTDRKNQTYIDDRNAFNNPGGNNNLYDIPPPPGMSQSAFDQNVISSGNTYSQGPYWPTGPNSNTTAFDIIRNAGGTPPTVPGAWGQGYVPTPLPELPIMP
ncbi:MAG: RHS repeat-associated core domain-containing protein [Sulfuricaulis sp.]